MTFDELRTALDDLFDDSGDTMFTSTVKDRYLNEAHQELYDELYQQTEWKLKSTTITTAAGTQSYNLPADFLYTRRVYRDTEYDLSPDPHRLLGMSDDRGAPVSYSIEGGYEKDGATTSYAQLNIGPVPDGVYTVTVDYFPVPFTMSAAADVSGIPVLYHGLIVTGAAIKCCLKKGFKEDRREFQNEYDERLKKLIAHVARRMKYDSPNFRNVF